MKCEKCGAEVPENTELCPECGAKLTAAAAAATAVRSGTVPQRPRTEYPARRRDRKKAEKQEEEPKPETSETKPKAAKKRGTGAVRRAVFGILLLILAGALLYTAVRVGRQIMNNRQEEPALSDIHAADGVREAETTPAQTAQEQEDEPAPAVSYELEGVWVWESDAEPMRETVWRFGADSGVTIYWFGIGEPENPFGEWPEHYAYDREKSVLTMAGEVLDVVWKSENSFHLESAVLGPCDAKRTDEAHIPTGAVDIRTLTEEETAAAPAQSGGSQSSSGSPGSSSGSSSGSTGSSGSSDSQSSGSSGSTGSTASDGEYIFADSASRYLKRSECQALTADQLRIARNEIYARHGRTFDSQDLQEYFDGMDWYKGTTSPSAFNYNILNDYERYNVNLMKSIEDAKRG